MDGRPDDVDHVDEHPEILAAEEERLRRIAATVDTRIVMKGSALDGEALAQLVRDFVDGACRDLDRLNR
jgi:hypothetical protein